MKRGLSFIAACLIFLGLLIALATPAAIRFVTVQVELGRLADRIEGEVVPGIIRSLAITRNLERLGSTGFTAVYSSDATQRSQALASFQAIAKLPDLVSAPETAAYVAEASKLVEQSQRLWNEGLRSSSPLIAAQRAEWRALSRRLSEAEDLLANKNAQALTEQALGIKTFTSARFFLIGSMIAILAAFALGVALVSRFAILPIIRASRMIRSAGKGRLLPSLGPSPFVELRDLGEAVTAFAEQLRKKEEDRARFQHLSETDPLTGLPNRRAFSELSDVILRSAELSNRPLAIAMMDLDHFKTVNDRFGHAAGDEVLVHFARLLSETKRHGDLVGRVGGEEFALVLPMTEPANAASVISRIVEGLGTHPMIAPDGSTWTQTVSAGLTMLVPGEGMERALVRADEALYRAKEGGRNKVVVA